MEALKFQRILRRDANLCCASELEYEVEVDFMVRNKTSFVVVNQSLAIPPKSVCIKPL